MHFVEMDENDETNQNQPGLGELLRHLQDLVDESSANWYKQLRFRYRPRYTPVMRALADGPASVTELKDQLLVTQGAVSQTIKLMLEDGLIRSSKGSDARQTIVSLSPAGESALKTLKPRWEAIFDAIAAMEEEIDLPLLAGLQRAANALEERPFADRISNRKRKPVRPKGSKDKTGYFQSGGSDYQTFRPSYPGGLAKALASLVKEPAVALDVGCGSGQLTTLLSRQFQTVFGIDPSANQLSNAPPADNVTYLQQSAEAIELSDESVDLIVAAQAAHWFDLEAFYQCARKVANQDAVLALVTYGVPYLSGAVNTTFQQGYWCDLHEFWPAERIHVETGYASLHFPFAPLEVPGLSCRKTVTLDQFIGYITTWSAYAETKGKQQTDRFEAFFEKLNNAWGDARTNEVVWPVTIRAGRIYN